MIFETKRLIARRFDPRDLDDFRTMRDHLDVARYQSWQTFSIDDAREFLRSLTTRNPGDPGWFQFALELRETGGFIGDCGLKMIEDNASLAQIGYTIAKPHWRQGLATEAVTALIGYAFASFAIERIQASIDPRNTASLRVLEKCGMRQEAFIARSEWLKGEWVDDMIYSIARGGRGD